MEKKEKSGEKDNKMDPHMNQFKTSTVRVPSDSSKIVAK